MASEVAGEHANHAQHVSETQVAPRAAWLSQQRELQWDMSEVHSGAELALRVLFPEQAKAGPPAAQGARAVVRFKGPPDETLSGLTLESGPVQGRLMDSPSRLHGKAVAKLE